MKKWTKCMAIALVAVMTLSLYGCSSSGETETTAGETAVTTSAVATEGSEAATDESGTSEVTEESGAALAEYPVETITWILAGNAGSGPDTFYRALMPYLETELDVTIVPENQLWNAALEELLGEASDGSFISNIPTPNAYKRDLDPSNDDDPSWQDLALVCGCYSDYTVVAVRSDDERFTDVNDLADLVAWCQENTDLDLLVGVKSALSADDLALYLLEDAAGIPEGQFIHVNSESASERNTSFLNGSVDIMLACGSEALSLYEEGTAKVISVMSEERSDFFPDVATATEAGYELVTGSVNGIVMHPDTDPAIIESVAETVKAIYEDPEFQETMTNLGYELSYMDADEFAAYLQEEEAALDAIKGNWGW